ncbi:hypothetical protein FKM82_024621 [Ascaphus truei]
MGLKVTFKQSRREHTYSDFLSLFFLGNLARNVSDCDTGPRDFCVTMSLFCLSAASIPALVQCVSLYSFQFYTECLSLTSTVCKTNDANTFATLKDNNCINAVISNNILMI